jgi:hypothetical protein
MDTEPIPCPRDARRFLNLAGWSFQFRQQQMQVKFILLISLIKILSIGDIIGNSAPFVKLQGLKIKKLIKR